MEVVVLNAEGAVLDPDIQVSIRAGPSRRQGPIELGKKICFPQKIKNAHPFKVDLHRHSATGKAKILPTGGVYCLPLEPLVHRASADLGTRPLVRLRVSCSPLLCGLKRTELKSPFPKSRRGANEEGDKSEMHLVFKPPERGLAGFGDFSPDNEFLSSDLYHLTAIGNTQDIKHNEDPTHSNVNLARRYFQDKNMMHLIQALLRSLVQDQPDDPFSYMAEFWAHLSKAVPSQDLLEFEFAAPFNQVSHEDFKAGLIAELNRIGARESSLKQLTINLREGSIVAELLGPLPVIAEIRDLPHSDLRVLGYPLKSHSEISVQSDNAEGDLEAIRIRALGSLVEASSNGRLEKELSDIRHVTGAHTSNPLQLAAVSDACGDVRQKVLGELKTAMKDGRLEQELIKLRQNKETSNWDAEELLDLRRTALETLIAANTNGQLHQYLHHVPQEVQEVPQQDHMNCLRSEALGTKAEQERLEAGENNDDKRRTGKEDKLQLGGSEDIETIRGKMLDMPFSASADGRLDKEMKLMQPDKKACDVLATASENGRLEDTLVTASKDGQLRNVLDEMNNNSKEEMLELKLGEPYHEFNHEEFMEGLITELHDAGAPEACVAQLNISFREGSTVAELRGPPHIINEMRKLPYSDLNVLGYPAKLWFDESSNIEQQRNQLRLSLLSATWGGLLARCLEAKSFCQENNAHGENAREFCTEVMASKDSQYSDNLKRDLKSTRSVVPAIEVSRTSPTEPALARCSQAMLSCPETFKSPRPLAPALELSRTSPQPVLAALNQVSPRKAATAPALGVPPAPLSPPGDSSHLRRTGLRVRQKELLEQNRAMHEQLKQLKERKKVAPPSAVTSVSPPEGGKPTGRRPHGVGSSQCDIHEVNRCLTAEHRRLQDELTQLVSLTAQRQKLRASRT